MLFTFAGFALGSLIPVVYQWSILRDIPVFQAIQESNRMKWKWWGEGFAMLELFFILGIGGLPFLWRRRRRPGALWIACWLLGAALVCPLPFSFQRRMIEGLPLALAFALPFCIEGWLIRPWLRRRIAAARRPGRRSLMLMRRVACWGVLALLLPRTLFIMNDHSFALYHMLNDLHYLHQEEVEAAEWLRTHSKGSEIVWASEVRGNRISFITGLRVFFGHDILTVDAGRKKIWCRDLFNFSMPAVEFRKIVEIYNIRYIFWTEHERRRDPLRRDFREFDPETLDPPVFQNSFVKIYPIRPSLFLR